MYQVTTQAIEIYGVNNKFQYKNPIKTSTFASFEFLFKSFPQKNVYDSCR